MKVIYYHNLNLGVSPVKQFLFKYDLRLGDTEKQRNHKIKTLAFLVLLNAFEKPDLYEKGLKEKIDKKIIKILEQTK